VGDAETWKVKNY
jgi:hypothetical protein